MHLLHIDSSIQGDRSVSRKLTARAAGVWRAAHPAGTFTYRDLGSDPVPHLDAAAGIAVRVPTEQRTPAQAASLALSEELVNEIKAADTVLLGLPLYNFGPPQQRQGLGGPPHRVRTVRRYRDPRPPCSAAANSSYSPAAAAATTKAHPATAGTTPNHGFPTPWHRQGWNPASSPPNSPSPTPPPPWQR
ncbi:MAG TPA: NAD(P)H-dependent oxidoreductase [Pseudonocardiaceae bacterium]|jgi:hypothetical protein